MLVANELEERSKQFIETAVRDFKIFIDTCSLLSSEADKFWVNIVPVLQRYSKTIIIPYRVYEELDKFANNPQLCIQKDPKNLNLNNQSIKARNNVVILQKAGLVEVFGNSNDNFADNVFQTVFTQYRMKYNLILITQDKNLANDIVNIGKSKAVNTNHRILVERINQYGFLSGFDIERQLQQAAPTNNHVFQSQNSLGADIPDEEVFTFSNSITTVVGKIAVSHIPKEGDTVTAERNGQRKLIKLINSPIASGGEGSIFSTDIPNVVAKIYKREKIDKAKYEKLKLMLTKSIDCEGVCFPLAVLYNSKNEFVGYLMNKAQGHTLRKCFFLPSRNKYFPNWKRQDAVQLCVTILEKIKYLHDRNVILGDINESNILVVSSTEVYFVDTDSYQIEGFPCPVGTPYFTAPEVQGKDFKKFLRSFGNENFAVATLLFMIMLPGKSPYAMQDGGGLIENIINMDFAYASGDKSTGKAPEGPWRYCWSHLPRYLKDAFYETFRKDEVHSTEGKRYSSEDWLSKFKYYNELLASGKLYAQDEESIKLFPSRLKKNKNATYIRCKLCSNEVDEDRAEQGYCQDCLKKGETYKCTQCGREIIYSNYQRLIKHSRRYDTCKDCKDKKNTVYTRSRCLSCGASYEITYGQKEFFESKGYQLPKKCGNCRSNKNSTSQMQSTYRSTSSSSSKPTYTSPPKPTYTSPPKPSNRGRGCFITTAVCEYLHKPDDCYELTTLRNFRDGWLALQPSGVAVIKEYYRVAPLIVNEINESDAKDAIYKEIWEKYISSCIKLIELSAYGACRDLYKEMVNNLKIKFEKE